MARQRVGKEVVAGLTPIGCPARAVNVRLPVPRWALEGTYRGPRRAPGVVLVLVFADPRVATRFLGRLTEQVQACPAPSRTPGPAGPGVLTFTPLASQPGTLTAWRQEFGAGIDPYRYLLVAVRVGRRVALGYLAGADSTDSSRIAAALRAVTR